MNKFVLVPHKQYESFKKFNEERKKGENNAVISEEKVVEDLKSDPAQNTPSVRLNDSSSLKTDIKDEINYSKSIF